MDGALRRVAPRAMEHDDVTPAGVVAVVAPRVAARSRGVPVQVEDADAALPGRARPGRPRERGPSRRSGPWRHAGGGSRRRRRSAQREARRPSTAGSQSQPRWPLRLEPSGLRDRPDREDAGETAPLDGERRPDHRHRDAERQTASRHRPRRQPRREGRYTLDPLLLRVVDDELYLLARARARRAARTFKIVRVQETAILDEPALPQPELRPEEAFRRAVKAWSGDAAGSRARPP